MAKIEDLPRTTFRNPADFGEAIIKLEPRYEGRDPEEVAATLLQRPEFEHIRIVEDEDTALGVLTDPFSLGNIDPDKTFSDLPSKSIGVSQDVIRGLMEAFASPLETGSALGHMASEGTSMLQAEALMRLLNSGDGTAQPNPRGFDWASGRSRDEPLTQERAEGLVTGKGIDPNVKDLFRELSFEMSAAGVEENLPRALSSLAGIIPVRGGLRALEKAPRMEKFARRAGTAVNLLDPATNWLEAPVLGVKTAAKGAVKAVKATGKAAAKTKAAEYFLDIGRSLQSEDVPFWSEIQGAALGFTTSLGRQYMEELVTRVNRILKFGEQDSFNTIFHKGRQAPLEGTVTEITARGHSGADRILADLQDDYNAATRRAFDNVDDTGIAAGSLMDDLQDAAEEFGVRTARTGADDVGVLRQTRLRPEDPLQVAPKFTVDDMVQQLLPQLRRQQGIDGRQQVLDEVRRISTGQPSPTQNRTLRQSIEQMIASDLPAGAQGSLAEEAMRIIRQEIKPKGRAKAVDIATDPEGFKISREVKKVAAAAQEGKNPRFTVDASKSDISEIGANRAIVEKALGRFLNMTTPRRLPAEGDVAAGLRSVTGAEGLGPTVLDARELHRLRKLLDDDISALSATSDVSRRTRSVLTDMRNVVADHLEANLGDHYISAMRKYEKGMLHLDEVAATLGFRPGMISKTGQVNPEGLEEVIHNVANAFSGKDSKARRLPLLEEFQVAAKDDYITPLIMGASARNLHGSGLVVRSEMAQILRGAAAFSAISLSGIPALALFSPRLMTEALVRGGAVSGTMSREGRVALGNSIAERMNALDKKTGGRLRRELSEVGLRGGELFQRLQIESERQGNERVQPPDDLLSNLSGALFGPRTTSAEIDSLMGAR